MPRGPANGLDEGASREHPIILDGMKSSDFAALLKVLYTFHFTNEKPKCGPEIIVPAFRLAHMWNFSDLREHLFPLVKDVLGCVDKVVLAKEFGIQEWLAPAHVELCQREESLTMEEGMKLGMHSTMMIFRLREKFRPPQTVSSSERAGNYCGHCLNALYYGSHGDVGCSRCSTYMVGNYWRVPGPATPPTTSPPSSSDELETQVKKWVEGGCVTE